MTVAATVNDWSVSGRDWFAQHHDGFLLVFVSPEADVAEAVETLIPAGRRHMWVAQAEGITDEGWEIWLLTRE